MRPKPATISSAPSGVWKVRMYMTTQHDHQAARRERRLQVLERNAVVKREEHGAAQRFWPGTQSTSRAPLSLM